jgi:hypothetical protein
MILVAALAAVLALPHLKTVTELRLAACLFAFLPLLVMTNAFVESVIGRPCPNCRRWTLWRLAARRSYYRCSHCRARFQRSLFGVWRDASGPEDDAAYRNKGQTRKWLGFARPHDPGETTTGLLLKNQRRRGRPGIAATPTGEAPTPPEGPSMTT